MKHTIETVANEVLEATVLSSHLDGDSALAKATRRLLHFGVRGTLAGGDLALRYTFPDGSEGAYALICGEFNKNTGFQAAAFRKTLKDADGCSRESVKIVFPGTTAQRQFTDFNTFHTFWCKRIGSQIYNAKAWMVAELLPRIHKRDAIEITSHCTGTQCALWAKAFLETGHYRVIDTALLEPTSAGLVVQPVIRDLADAYDITPAEALQKLAHNMYSAYVSPSTIVNPVGYGRMWDTMPVGEQAFFVHLPEAGLGKELSKAARSPRAFFAQLGKELRESAKGHIALAFFRTELGKALEQRLFRNHYLYYMAKEILKKQAIAEKATPDLNALLERRPPAFSLPPRHYFRQRLIAYLMDIGRALAGKATSFRLRGKRIGVPLAVMPYLTCRRHEPEGRMDHSELRILSPI